MEYVHETNRIFAVNGDGMVVAEIKFPDMSDGKVDISHTFVDENLRGKGIASELMKEAYMEIKKQQKKAVITCSYAVEWFAKHKEYADILE